MQQLCMILMASGVPADVLTEVGLIPIDVSGNRYMLDFSKLTTHSGCANSAFFE